MRGLAQTSRNFIGHWVGDMSKDTCRIIVFSFFLICGALCAFADNGIAAESGDSAVSEAAPAETGILLQTDESALPVQDVPAPRAAGSSTVSMLVQLVISLAAVCALIYGVLYFIRRSKQFTAADDPFLKNVASLPIAPNKTLYIVTLIDKAYLIGASDASLSLIAEITDKELIDAMNLHAAQTTAPKQSFSSLLETFFPAAKPKETDTSPFDSFLAKQRGRLQNSDAAQGDGTLQGSEIVQETETGSTEQRRMGLGGAGMSTMESNTRADQVGGTWGNGR